MLRSSVLAMWDFHWASSTGGAVIAYWESTSIQVEAIRSGRSYLQYISGAAIAELVSNGHFDATTDFSRVAEARAVIICVPTPLDISAALPSPYRLFDGFRQTAHRTLKALLPTGPSFSTAGHIIAIAR